jgi:HEAT repeat protein
MDQLNDVRTVRADTVSQILEISRKDPRAREYVVQKLPELIRRPMSDVWLDAIRLAGKLKAKEAIPALQEALSRPPIAAERSITFAGVERLDNDIVAKALSQIGDPAIPAVVNLLNSPVKGTRGRGVLILRNIGSPAARKTLQERLRNEPDPEVKKLIQDSLRP